MMRVAKAMETILKTAIRFQTVVNQSPAKVRQNIEIVHRLTSAFPVNADPCQQRSCKRMHPMEFCFNAHTRFVSMSDRNATQSVGDHIDGRRKKLRRLDVRLRDRSFTK